MSNFTEEQFIQYAEMMMVHPENDYSNAMIVLEGDTAGAYKLINEASRSVVYIKAMSDKHEKQSNELPTKEATSKLVYNIANNDRNDAEVRLKAIELYAKINSMIERPMPQIAVQQNTTNKVMILKSAGSDVEWEEKAALQQAKLVGNL